MQIRKSADGSQPQHPNNNGPKNTGSDKDLGTTRKEAVEGTRPADSEKRAENQPKKETRDVRPNRDSFERSKPTEDPGVDVGERLRKARTQARENRIENARTKHTQEQGAERIKNARADSSRARREARLEDARAKHSEQAHAERIESARTDNTKNADPVARARASFGNLSRESVQLSAERVSGEEIQSATGARETNEARAERIQILRMEHENGILNTVERSREAARRLLGDL